MNALVILGGAFLAWKVLGPNQAQSPTSLVPIFPSPAAGPNEVYQQTPDGVVVRQHTDTNGFLHFITVMGEEVFLPNNRKMVYNKVTKGLSWDTYEKLPELFAARLG